jgi:hypothetical protein
MIRIGGGGGGGMVPYSSPLIFAKAGERQPRAPGQIGEHGSPVPLNSHVDGHTKIYFVIAINEGIASELLARNCRRISVPMVHVACMHVTVPVDGRNQFVQYR